MTQRDRAIAASVVLVGLCASAAAKEEKVTLGKVPAKVAQAEKAK